MRQVLPTTDLTQPFVAIVCYDAATNTPTFAFTTFGLNVADAKYVVCNTTEVPILTNIDNVQVTEDKPDGLGKGLIRREVTFDVKSNGPFALAPLSNMLYSAGATTDTFYFGVWVTDYTKSLTDILQTGIFFGYYKLDMGMSWEENSLVTGFKLSEIVTLMNGRYNTNTEAAEELLDGSEWQRLIDAPAYLGYRGKVKATGRVDSGISGYESYSKSVRAVIAGIVQSSTLSGTSINLGKSPTLASVVGSSIKLKFGNGCLVAGTVTDLGGGEYGIDTTGMTLNAAWDTIDVKNVGTLAPAAPLTLTFKPNEVMLDTALLTRIPSPTMYLRSSGNIEFYLAGVQTSATPLYLKLTGIVDEATKTLSCEDFKDPANPTWPRTGVNVDFNAGLQSTNFTGADAHFNYASWLVSQNYTLHFSNKTFVLADVQKEGMPWEVIVTPHVNSSIATPNVFYVRMIDNTTIMEDGNGAPAIFYDKGDTLVTVPASAIASIQYANTDFSMVNLCKITLNSRPSDVDVAYDNNFLYVDTWPPMYSAEVIKYILLQGGMDTSMLGASLTSDTDLGNTLSLEVEDETWSELLDTVMFESGLQLDASIGLYHVGVSFNKATIKTFNRGASTETYQRVVPQADIAFGDVVDGTYKFTIGRTLTNVDANGREYVRVHYTFNYPYSTYGGTKLRTLRSTKAVKDNDRIIDYTFKHVADTLTCTAAAAQMTHIGHIANIPETTRIVEVGLPFKYAYLQAMDVVSMKDFRHISAEDSPLPLYDPAITTNPVYTLGELGVYAKYTQTTPFMLIPGIGVISRITYNFSGNGIPVTVSIKQVQPGTTSNLKEVAINLNVNTDVENATEDAITPEDAVPVPPNYHYYCPDSSPASVTVTPGEPTVSSATVSDACCNTTTDTATTYSDAKVVVVCDPTEKGLEWPDGCFALFDIYTDPDDTEIGNMDTIQVPVWGLFSGDVVGSLNSISYAGMGDVPSDCVIFVAGDGVEVLGYGNALGVLFVKPCFFNSPAGMPVKPIYLEFKIVKCSIFPVMVDHDDDLNTPPIATHPPTITYKTVQVTIALRPVSDITVS